jgi:putative phosphoribosyl transferase
VFRHRTDAGEQLAERLGKYKDQDVLVLAIPRGGVEVGHRIAEYLHAELSLIVSRKLPFPHNTESGFGALAEDGSLFVFEDTTKWLPERTVQEIVDTQKKVIADRIRTLRKNKPLPEVEGRTVILVDDGIAMGSTMRVSVKLCRNKKAGKIIVAVPVSSQDVRQVFQQLADEVIVLETPADFRAVAQVYQNWYDVSDEEVLAIMNHKNP